jgi:hypothetical protein
MGRVATERSGISTDLSGGPSRNLRLWTGAIAGVFSAVAFAGIHYVFISDIWDMIGVMSVAGGLSGLCLAWSYRRLRHPSSARRWLLYNLTYVASFAVVPALSMLLFEPVMSFAEAAASEGPLDELIVKALPFTIGAVIAIAALVSVAFGSLRHDFGPILITVVVLMAFLGLNLTIIGLVGWSSSMPRVIAGFIGLILAIGLVYASTYLAFEWSRIRPTPQGSDPARS